MLACSQLITNFHRWYNLQQLVKFFKQIILLFVKVENWARICSDWEIFGNAKTSANWPKLSIKCLNSINILNENWSSQSLILGQFWASMTEPHFRININIYNDVNINVNVKITIAHQVGIILQPLGSDHSSLNNTIEFRTSHSNQLVFIALFFAKREHTMENWNCEIAPT